MNYHTRKWVKPEDLNPNHSLFGGRLLQWIDEEAALYAIIQLENTKVVTKFISEINFVSSAKQGDIIEIGIEAIHFGSSSITLRCDVRNKMTTRPLSPLIKS
jgi:acyl-CoA hydrolase